jgi:hypothetical protein
MSRYTVSTATRTDYDASISGIMSVYVSRLGILFLLYFIIIRKIKIKAYSMERYRAFRYEENVENPERKTGKFKVINRFI